jgi:hypothetical protein
MLSLVLSFLGGIVTAVTVIRLYSIFKRSQLAELVIIAVRKSGISAPSQAPPQPQPDFEKARAESAEKERAMAAIQHVK